MRNNGRCVLCFAEARHSHPPVQVLSCLHEPAGGKWVQSEGEEKGAADWGVLSCREVLPAALVSPLNLGLGCTEAGAAQQRP